MTSFLNHVRDEMSKPDMSAKSPAAQQVEREHSKSEPDNPVKGKLAEKVGDFRESGVGRKVDGVLAAEAGKGGVTGMAATVTKNALDKFDDKPDGPAKAGQAGPAALKAEPTGKEGAKAQPAFDAEPLSQRMAANEKNDEGMSF